MKRYLASLIALLLPIVLIGCDSSLSQQPTQRNKPDKPFPSVTPVSGASPIITPTPPVLPSVPPDPTP